jgi:hypothetical protein
MSRFAQFAPDERGVFIQEAAERLNVLPVIIEKDYWVAWILGRVFGNEAMAPHLVFKGGTSLSKVFGAIQRFSEDIDLSVSPVLLGFSESELDDAPSVSKRRKLFGKLQSACAEVVADRFLPELEKTLREQLGVRTDGRDWLSYHIDQTTDSPILLFEYPSTLTHGGGYIQPTVKLEFGSLTDQRPTGTHSVKPLLADAFSTFAEDCEEVVALEVERTFWEKATILHAEYHRPLDQPVRDRFARHYSDLAALCQHPAKLAALHRLDLLERVAKFKARFFASSWANYKMAKPGSLKLSPPIEREVELERDYSKMEPMFIVSPPTFTEVLRVLGLAEQEINAS